jgi:hypothetical protein
MDSNRDDFSGTDKTMVFITILTLLTALNLI